MLTLFKSLVLPHLDYCSQLWSPNKQQEIDQLEQIQRTYTSKITGSDNLTYIQRLEKFKLYSLERRRERYLVIYAWKILEGLVDNPNDKVASRNHVRLGRIIDIPSWTNSNSTKISNQKHNFFLKKAPRMFNKLPRQIRDISGTEVQSFKRAVDHFLQNIPDHPTAGSLPIHREAATNSLESWLPLIKRKTPSIWAYGGLPEMTI